MSGTRGQVNLQPSYFTSSIYVKALRADISTLVFNFHESYARDNANPFGTFKSLWEAQGWKWLHFRVFDNRARETFLNVTMRLFLERMVKTEAPFTRVVALFALYTFFNTQPTGSAPPLHVVSHIPIAIDHYNTLLQFPQTLANPFLAPLQPFASYVLSNLVQGNAFYLLPGSELGAMNPRELPREIFVEEGLIDGNQPQRKGQYSKRDKVVKARSALETMARLLQQSKPLLGTTGFQYDRQKQILLDQLGIDNPMLQETSESVVARLREAHEQEADVEQWNGLERLNTALSVPGGLLKLVER
ncbi:GH16 domain-containing protein [Mycena indigotica]|uniref:GH16 domain-containing protein n=1 Tax=Mycena indigotica TaxID=2126181 RepID=A0A8H6SZK8_9AGAR|nr:GH16 domain-containing protein [Mycena indigotica]KAF7306775.1 GH16 domain-containing protein [Mycena indigotica]